MEPVHGFDHLNDREGLPAIAPRIFRREPIEAEIGIIGAGLLREEHDKAVIIGRRRPRRTSIIGRRRLRAAVEHDN